MDNRLRRHYDFNAHAGIWQRETEIPFGYSDGEDIEESLLRSLAAVTDKSILSEELFRLQKDWPSHYHLSAMRANLLRPLASTVLKKANVLELGCGCGAITRFLAETAASVCAVEGSARRAAIAANRCSDLQNVSVIVDKIQDLPADLGKFDVVTLIGVLEYAGVFSEEENPALSLLQTARGFLKEDGCLVLALENKVGLKYFAGVPEDHLGLAWGGVAGAYRERDVATYSRKELVAMLEDAGFGFYEQFIPVPDYKLPTGVLTPAGIGESRPDWNVATLLGGRRAYEEQGIFNLPNAWETIVKAGLLPEMADSMCFIAYAAQENPPQSAWGHDVLMYHYGYFSLRESKKYAKCAMFKRTEDGIQVCRSLLYPGLQEDNDSQFVFKPESEPYIAGTELLAKARHAVSRPGWTVQEFAKALSPWIEELKKHRDANGFLPKNFLDAAPFNTLITPDGKVRFFDLEWSAQEPVPFLFIVTNSLYTTFERLGGVCQPAWGVPIIYPELVLALLREWGLDFSMDAIKLCRESGHPLWTKFVEMHNDWELLYSRTLFVVPSISYAANQNAAAQERDALAQERDALAQERDALAQERDALAQERDTLVQERDTVKRLLDEVRQGYENSHSWRITAPLRYLRARLKKIPSAGKKFKDLLACCPFEDLQGLWAMAKKIFSRFSLENVKRAWSYAKQHGIRQTARRAAQKLRSNEYSRQDVIASSQPIFEPPQPSATAVSGVRAIAFYLPQFHPFPENDAWWGEGFTEWTNVSKAKPVFAGHVQPKLPGALGFYDLRLPEVMRKQAALAKEFGIHGFCFYYYWFAGKRLLERPLEQWLADPSIDFPFCLCWANENWTRRWDGNEQEVLIAQQHSAEDDRAVMRDILRYMADPRYIRVDGRPVLLIYRASLLPDMKATLGRWREECTKRSEKTPYFIMVQSFDNYAPSTMGFDAAVQFPPLLPGYLQPRVHLATAVPGFKGKFLDYNETSNAMLAAYNPSLPTYPCVFPAWDNTARRGLASTVVVSGTPKKYERWLRTAAKQAKDNFSPEKSLVFINAWNEWAEGAYLEPDRDYGYAYLNATSRALSSSNDQSSCDCVAPECRLRVLFIGHDAALAGAQILLLHTLRWLKHHTAVEPYLLLLGDGALREEFEDVCPVLLCPDGKVTQQEIEDFCRTPDVIFGNSAVSSNCYDVLSMLDAPIVTYIHELENSIKKWVPQSSLDKMYKYTSAYIAGASPVKDNLHKRHAVEEDLISVIDAFIAPMVFTEEKAALRRRLGLPGDACIVLGCGSMDWRKGPDLFVEAAHLILQNTDAPVFFCWVGGGSDPSIVDPHKLAQQFGIADKVFFAGQSETHEVFFQAADIFLLTSREDPFPLVALEACDCSLPVICFADTGGMPEFIRTGAGSVVPFADVQAMAKEVLSYIHDEGKRKTVGKTARACLLNAHTSDIAVPQILHVLRTVAQKPYPISVIVPNYNYARYLPERLESIFTQTFRDMEVILLDDASTDGSLQILEKWTNRAGVRLIVNEQNGGSVFSQWKKGLEKAQGDFIWIAETDDLCAPNFLATMLRPLKDNEVVLAYSIPSVIDSDGKTVDLDYRTNYLTFADKERWKQSYACEGEREVCEALGIVNCIPNVSAALFRKPDDANIIDAAATFSNSGDWMFYLYLSGMGKIAYVHGNLASHRRHAQSVIAKDEQNRRKILYEEIKRIHEWVAEHYPLAAETKEKMKVFLSDVEAAC